MTTMTNKSKRMADYGFTLTELAVVMVIVALLIGGLLLPLAAQEDLRKVRATESTLYEVRDALLGFAAANGRLPCPASLSSNGKEEFCTEAPSTAPTPADQSCTPTPMSAYASHGRCSHPYDGYVPAAVLGLQPINDKGLLVDAWNEPIRFAVATDQLSGTETPPFAYAFTGASGMKKQGLTNLKPDLAVCSTASKAGYSVLNPGASGATCPKDDIHSIDFALISNAAAVIYSLGANSHRRTSDPNFLDGKEGGTGADEKHNPNANTAVPNDRVFISHEPAPKEAANGEFDDIVIWLSPNILYSRMIAAGRLP